MSSIVSSIDAPLPVHNHHTLGYIDSLLTVTIDEGQFLKHSLLLIETYQTFPFQNYDQHMEIFDRICKYFVIHDSFIKKECYKNFVKTLCKKLNGVIHSESPNVLFEYKHKCACYLLMFSPSPVTDEKVLNILFNKKN